MDTLQLEELHARVARLERAARRWRRAAGVAGGVLGLVVLVGATAPKAAPVADEIRARQFVLVDDEGRVLGRWDALFDFARLALFDQHGRSGLQLTALPIGGGHMTVRRPDDSVGIVLGTEPDGGSYMHFNGLVGRPGIVLRAEPDGGASLDVRGRVYKADGTPAGPSFVPERLEGLLDETSARVTLSVDKDERAAVLVREAHSRRGAVLGTTTLEERRSGSVTQRSASSLVLFDKDGTVLFKLP